MKLRILALALAGLITSCDRAHTVPQSYFLLPILRNGWNRPSAPSNLHARYSVSLDLLTLDWTGSLDPDTGLPNVVYNIYGYELPPREYYRPQDLLDTTTAMSYFTRVSRFTGTLYFVVTASDGGAESLPSNVAQMETVL